jgi:hypothetical protein
MGVGGAIGNYLFTETLPLCRWRNIWNFYQYKTQKMALALDGMEDWERAIARLKKCGKQLGRSIKVPLRGRGEN